VSEHCPRPVNETGLLNPTLEDALITAGALIHFVASSPDVVTRFARWAEHCPGDLDDSLVLGVLSATHDVLQPGCPDPVVIP
jgi:hypothetical protein